MPDLPPRRAARSSGSRHIIGRLSPTIRALLIAEVAIYAVYLLVRPLRPAMEAHLAVGPRLGPHVGDVQVRARATCQVHAELDLTVARLAAAVHEQL